MKLKRLTKKAFIAWIQNKPCNTIIGGSRCPGLCPIAKFIRQCEPNIKSISVYNPTFLITKNIKGLDIHTLYYLPKWAKDFVSIVDRYYTSVSREQALKILEDL